MKKIIAILLMALTSVSMWAGYEPDGLYFHVNGVMYQVTYTSATRNIARVAGMTNYEKTVYTYVDRVWYDNTEYEVEFRGESPFADNPTIKTINLAAYFVQGNYWIPDGFFKNAEALESVYVSEYCIHTGDSTFEGCKSLKRVMVSSLSDPSKDDYPAQFKGIGTRAFYGCSSLKEIDLTQTSTIGEEAFAYSGLKSIHFDNNKNTYLDPHAFMGTNPDTVALHGNNAVQSAYGGKPFEGADIKVIWLDESVTQTPEEVFVSLFSEDNKNPIVTLRCDNPETHLIAPFVSAKAPLSLVCDHHIAQKVTYLNTFGDQPLAHLYADCEQFDPLYEEFELARKLYPNWDRNISKGDLEPYNNPYQYFYDRIYSTLDTTQFHLTINTMDEVGHLKRENFFGCTGVYQLVVEEKEGWTFEGWSDGTMTRAKMSDISGSNPDYVGVPVPQMTWWDDIIDIKVEYVLLDENDQPQTAQNSLAGKVLFADGNENDIEPSLDGAVFAARYNNKKNPGYANITTLPYSDEYGFDHWEIIWPTGLEWDACMYMEYQVTFDGANAEIQLLYEAILLSDMTFTKSEQAFPHDYKVFYKKNGGQSISNIQSEAIRSTKLMHEGNLYILRNGKVYTVTGQHVQ